MAPKPVVYYYINLYQSVSQNLDLYSAS